MVTLLVTIGLVLAVGAIVIQTMGSAPSINPDLTTVQNISNIRTVAVVYNLTATPVTGGSIGYWNVTGAAMNSANYTVYPSNGTVVFHSGCVDCNASYAYVSYNYGQQSSAYNISAQANSGIGTFADFQSVIAIVLVATIILGLVGLIAFASRT
jgi:hypothetical protein